MRPCRRSVLAGLALPWLVGTACTGAGQPTAEPSEIVYNETANSVSSSSSSSSGSSSGGRSSSSPGTSVSTSSSGGSPATSSSGNPEDSSSSAASTFSSSSGGVTESSSSSGGGPSSSLSSSSSTGGALSSSSSSGGAWFCGNGVVETGEECDPPNGTSCDGLCQHLAPAGWRCDTDFYGDTTCDCGCGAQDLDCASLDASICGYNNCSGGQVPISDDNAQCHQPPAQCGNNVVESPAEDCDPPDGNTCDANCQRIADLPADWVCPGSYYDDGPCDCGCGAQDEDCDSLEVGECEYNVCPDNQVPVPDDNAHCEPERAECGDGTVDPGEQCDPPDGTTCNAACQRMDDVPADWTCSTSFYNDGPCDCGCGAQDEDCNSLASGECTYNNCPNGQEPVPGNNAECQPTASVCGDGQVGVGEECDPPDGTTCDANCQLVDGPVCGNGVLEGDEQCDPPDGTTCDAACRRTSTPPAEWTCPSFYWNDSQFCDCGCGAQDPDCPSLSANDCTYDNCPVGEEPVPDNNAECAAAPPRCGNGVLDPGEQCDPPDGSTCDDNCQRLGGVPAEWTCQPQFYADGQCDCGCGAQDIDCDSLDADECDVDSCPAGQDPVPDDNTRCETVNLCGNNVVDPGEGCDPPDGVTCDASCQEIPVPECNNGVVEAGEECDPPDGLTCDESCQLIDLPVCNNGVVEAGEECDPPDGVSCDESCQLIENPDCGNGVVDPGEECEFPNQGNCGPACQFVQDPPAEWSCDPVLYADGFCDCGCGAQDHDCPSLDATDCLYNNCPNGTLPVSDNNAACAQPECGNGVVEGDEDCDPPDGLLCDEACHAILSAACGNGVVDAGEECEPAEEGACDANCESTAPNGWTCEAAYYGDLLCDCGCGVVDIDCESATSACDDCFHADANSNGVPDGSCDIPDEPETDCTTIDPDNNAVCAAAPQCGNGSVEAGEDCDPPDGLTCDEECHAIFTATCGNGLTEEGEGCEPAGQGACDVNCASTAPEGWTCEPAYYGDLSCDCGCGIVDVDCPGDTLVVCQYCFQGDGNNNGVPDGSCDQRDGQLTDCTSIDPSNNAECLVDVCGNGLVEAGEECEPPGVGACNESCESTAPEGWTCEAGYYGDGPCDCGCGIQDVDCPNNTAAACNYCLAGDNNENNVPDGSCDIPDAVGTDCSTITPDNNATCTL
ncbi:MAG: hypothetical protein AB2A00_12105 [Myxococcota bacterium]